MSYRSYSSTREKEPIVRVYRDGTHFTYYDCTELVLPSYADRQSLVILDTNGKLSTYVDTGEEIEYSQGCIYTFITRDIHWTYGKSVVVIADTDLAITTSIYLEAPKDVVLVGRISYIDDTLLTTSNIRVDKQVDVEGEARNGLAHRSTIRAKYTKAYYIEGKNVVRVAYFAANSTLTHIQQKMDVFRQRDGDLDSLGVATTYSSANKVLYFITDGQTRDASYQDDVVTNHSNDEIIVIYHTPTGDMVHLSLKPKGILVLRPEEETPL
jgi:hypothetical protein